METLEASMFELKKKLHSILNERISEAETVLKISNMGVWRGIIDRDIFSDIVPEPVLFNRTYYMMMEHTSESIRVTFSIYEWDDDQGKFALDRSVTYTECFVSCVDVSKLVNILLAL